MSYLAALPKDAEYLLGATYFKFGLRGKPYRWNGEEWLFSSIDPEVLMAAKRLVKSLPKVNSVAPSDSAGSCEECFVDHAGQGDFCSTGCQLRWQDRQGAANA